MWQSSRFKSVQFGSQLYCSLNPGQFACSQFCAMFTRCSAIAERPHCRVLVWPKVEDWNWETIFYGHHRSILYHCDIIGLQSYRIRWKKRKIRAITRFKVIEVSINRKPVCDFLLVINRNRHPISYRFGVIAAYCSKFGHFPFSRPHLGGLETTYNVHLGLIGKHIVDFLLVLIALHSVLRLSHYERSDRKSAISLQRGHFDPKGSTTNLFHTVS